MSASLSEGAVESLTRLGTGISLRYALQLLAPAAILARARAAEGVVVGEGDVGEAEGLFWDAGRSARGLAEGGAGFIS